MEDVDGTHRDGGVAAVTSDGPAGEHGDGDGGTHLQDEQNQEEPQRSENCHLTHIIHHHMSFVPEKQSSTRQEIKDL